jgi:NitT/TauT family transport system substrate-binding protein
MIYNEYAQVLETKNPATGNLFTPDDLNVISWEKYGTSMLQDAIFASEAWLAQSGNEDTAVKFLKASFKGWIYCRDNPEPCVDIVLKSDAKLPKGHQTWQLNEVNGSSGRPRTGSASRMMRRSTGPSKSRRQARS